MVSFMMGRLAAATVFGAYALLLWGCSSASVRERSILPYDDEIADVSLPMPLPAPRDGPDIKDGTVTAFNRPSQEMLTPSGTRKMVSDNRLRTDVLAAVVDDPAVDPFQFRYVVEDGKVEIRGQGSDRQKRRVTETVSRVRGVREVQSPVSLPKGADPNWAAPVTDEEIERAIVDAVARDPNADLSHVEIFVQDGAVALSGTTPNMRTRQAIEKNARAMQGVKAVRNLIEVKPKYIRDDERLVRDVRTALSFEPLLNSNRIQVSASRGRVTLKGQVTSSWKKERATELGSEVFGVISIENDLAIAKLPASGSDAVLN
jgi:osmotically-inducible protein OsmY